MYSKKKTIRLPRAALALMTFLFAVLALLPRPGQAALLYSDVTMNLAVECSVCDPFAPSEASVGITVPPTDPQVYQRLIHVPPDVAYANSAVFMPFRPGGLPGLFASSAMSAESPVGVKGGVGVSGTFSGGTLNSEAKYQQFVTNSGPNPVTVSIHALVPQLSVLFYGDHDFDTPLRPGDAAAGTARLSFEIVRNTGERESVFYYQASINKKNLKNDLDSVSLFLSPELRAAVDGAPSILNPIEVMAFPNAPTADDRISGYIIDEFTSTYRLTLAPFEAIGLEYYMNALGFCSNNLCDDGTGGVHAAVGDPISLQGAQPLFTLAEVPPDSGDVPLPGTALLLLGGLLALFRPIINTKCVRFRF